MKSSELWGYSKQCWFYIQQFNSFRKNLNLKTVQHIYLFTCYVLCLERMSLTTDAQESTKIQKTESNKSTETLHNFKLQNSSGLPNMITIIILKRTRSLRQVVCVGVIKNAWKVSAGKTSDSPSKYSWDSRSKLTKPDISLL